MEINEQYDEILKQIEIMLKDGYTILDKKFNELCKTRNELKRKMDIHPQTNEDKKFIED